MAKILRHGRTPKWGLTGAIDGLILDSFNQSVEIKDYEQTDENGAVCGYLVYDQTVSFDFSGTVVEGSTFNYSTSLASDVTDAITPLLGTSVFNPEINVPATAILKSYSVSEGAGSASTISGSGTIYAFSSTTEQVTNEE